MTMRRYEDVKATTRLRVTPALLDRLMTFFVHGHLPTGMAHALACPTVDRTAFSKYLKHDKRHELIHQDNKNLKRRDDHLHSELIFNITAKGVNILERHGRIKADDAILWEKLRGCPMDNDYYHDVATSLVTASIELGARKLGIEFISFYDILRNAPEQTREQKNPLSIECIIPYPKKYIAEYLKKYKKEPPPRTSRIVMDVLFGLGDGSETLYWAVETEMGTNQGDYSDLKHSSIARKVLCYRYIWSHEKYKEHFNIPGMKLIVPCATASHKRKIMRVVKEQAEEDEQVDGYGPIYLRDEVTLDRRLYMPFKYDGSFLLEEWELIGKDARVLFKRKTALENAA